MATYWVKGKGTQARKPQGDLALEPDVSGRGKGHSEISIRQRQGAEFAEEQSVAEHLRERVGAKKCGKKPAHEGKEMPLTRRKAEAADEDIRKATQR
jgi:hypothetical protein